ncbi:MAG: hypothetical protein IKR04_02970 [Clostridia bacterium]|nr:hypothetical protein [Clostridia bacterium]
MKKNIFGLILILIFTILFTGVTFASKTQFDVSTGIIGDSNGSATADSWGYSRNRCGTRYVLEIDDEEVGGGNHLDYYVNHITTGNNVTHLYMGTNYNYSSDFYAGSLNYNGFYTVSGLPANPDGASAKYWFTNWLTANPNSSNFNPGTESAEFERIKFIAGCIMLAAKDAGDTTTANQMQSIIDDSISAKLAVKAEILFYVFPPKALTGNTRKSLFLTYNEVRAYADDGNHRGGIRYMRGGGNVSWYKADGGSLDIIATKLYEKDQEYALVGNSVNCKCNMLTNKYGYTATLDGKYLKFSGGSLSSWDKPIGGTNVSDAVLPNMCSVKAGGSYYSMGLRKGGSNDPVSSDFYVDGNSAKGTHMQAECKGWDFMKDHSMVSGSSAIINKAFIFEGWDYLWWGQRKTDKGNIYANWLVKNGNSYSAISGISRYENLKQNFGKYTVKNNEGGRTTTYEYKGYYVQDGNIPASSASIGTLKTDTSVTVEISKNKPNKTIHFVFEEKEPEKGNIYANWLVKNGNSYKAISGISRYEDKNKDFGTYKVKNNVGGRSATNYTYKGYCVQNGNIDASKASIGTLNTSGTAQATIDASNKNKTIHFVYEEIKGTVKVRHVVITSANVAKVIEPNNTTYNYTKNNVSLGDFSATKAYSNNNYRYLGYAVNDGLIATLNYNLDSTFTNGNTVKVKLTASKTSYTITFAYVDESFEPIKVGLNVLHYDKTNGVAMSAPRGITVSWNDIADIMVQLYGNVNNKSEVIKEYNKIVSDSSLNDNQKIASVLEKFIKPKWDGTNLPGLKSLSLKPESMKKYHLLPENERIDIKSKKSSAAIVSSVDLGNTQVMPSFDDVKAKVENKTILPNGVTNDNLITITIYYSCDKEVVFEHYDKETGAKLPARLIEDKKIAVEKGGNVTYTGFNLEAKKYYYAPEYTVAVNGTPIITNNQSTIVVGPVNVDEIVRLYYFKAKTLKIKHVDKNNTSIVLEQEPDQVLVYNSTIDARARIGDKGVTGNPPKGDKVYATYTSDSSYYHYECTTDDYSVSPSAALKETKNNNSIATIKHDGSYTEDSVNVVFKYQKYWPIHVYFKDYDTHESIKDENGNVFDFDTEDKDGASHTERYKDLKYLNYKFVENDTNKEKELTKIINQETGFTFYYVRVPAATGEIIPTEDVPLPVDPTDPSSPYNPGSPFYNKKLIVLDDVFGMKYTINNYDKIAYNAELYLTFPFDVYYNDKFYNAGEKALIETFDPNVIDHSIRTYEGTIYFRLPSWVIERDYTGDTHLILRYSDVPYPDGEDDPLSDEPHSITVIGRLYDFTVTAIDEGVSENQAKWTLSLFGKLGYANGDNKDNEYKADTLPIGQNNVKSNVSTYKVNTPFKTQNPAWPRGMAIGTPFLFSINTKGLMSNKISIEPKLEFYDTNGNIVSNARFVYQNAQGYVEFTNSNGIVVANAGNFETKLTNNLRYTTEVKKEVEKANQLRQKGNVNLLGSAKQDYANVMNAYSTFAQADNVKFGDYNKLIIPNKLRLPFVNYYAEPANTNNIRYNEAQKIGNRFNNDLYYDMDSRVTDRLNYINSTNIGDYNIKSANVGMNQDAIINSLGHWYAEYNLPASLKVYDSSGKEIDHGFIVVKFKIRTLRNPIGGETTGDKEYLTYWKGRDASGTILNSQWTAENKTLTSTNNRNINVNFPIISGQNSVKYKSIDVSDGYYPVAIYEAGFSINDFYQIAGTH